MLVAQRRDLLAARLLQDGKLVVRELAQELGLSEDCVRRDLQELAAAGLCQRVYGGALPLSPATGAFAPRRAIGPENKRRVAARAARLITTGTIAILGGGTTPLAIVAELPHDLRARIVTPSPTTAAALVDHPTVDVFLLGGRLNKQVPSVFGSAAAEAAGKISADLYLLGAAGVHPKEGFTTADPDQAAIDRLLVSRAAETYVLVSSEKLGTVAPFLVVGLPDVTGIITDAEPGHPVVERLRRQGVDVVHAP